MALIRLDQVVKELCRECGEPDYRNYNALLSHVRRGYMGLNLSNMPSTRWVNLMLNNLNAIEWPEDCIKPIIVGLCRGGRIVNLDVDPYLCLPNYCTCKTLSEAQKEVDEFALGVAGSPYGYYYYNTYDSGIGELYGVGGGYNSLGYIKHDKENRMTYVQGPYAEGDTFVLYYKCDVNILGLVAIPVEVERAVREYAFYEYYRVKAPTLSDRAWERYKAMVTELNKFNQARTESEWISALTSNEMSAPK